MELKGALSTIRSGLLQPTSKQKDAYTRFFHTLSAACFIGLVTQAWQAPPLSMAFFLEEFGLFVLGVLLFFVGMFLSTGA